MAIVLVVENDPASLLLLIRVLATAGHTVWTATDGRAALGQLDPAGAGLPDAVVLDVSLPGPSGLDVCRQVRATPATANLPVLMVSAHVTERDVRAGVEAGADCYLGKPFSVAELVGQVRSLLDITPASAAQAAAVGMRGAAALSGLTPAPLRARRHRRSA